MELTLLTINTWKCDGDYYNRREVLKKELARSGAQVILCQECFRSLDSGVDTLDYLSHELGMSAYAAPAREKKRLLGDHWVDSSSGLGVLTNLPVKDVSVIELPSNEIDGGRKAQLLTIKLTRREVLLIANVHLTHLADDTLRRHQLQVILDRMATSKAAFRIIGGDWNAGPGSAMLRQMMDTTPAADCYVLGNGEDRPRWLDHFFTLPARVAGDRSTYPAFTRAGIVLDQPDAQSGLYPSDHFGIRITLIY